MSRVFFASDLHHGHKAITKYRNQFSSTEEHDEIIADNILSTCGRRDTLWLLGDLFFTQDSLQYFDRYVDNIGQVNIILGNHCTDNSERQRAMRYAASRCNKIGGLFNYKGFWLSHAPIHPDELRDKLNIHGHMHRLTIDDPRYFSVCLEQIDYKPIHINEIKERIAQCTK